MASRQARRAGRSNRLAGHTSECTDKAGDSHSVYSLDDVLDHIREAMRVDTVPEDSMILMEGTQCNRCDNHDQYSLTVGQITPCAALLEI